MLQALDALKRASMHVELFLASFVEMANKIIKL